MSDHLYQIYSTLVDMQVDSKRAADALERIATALEVQAGDGKLVIRQQYAQEVHYRDKYRTLKPGIDEEGEELTEYRLRSLQAMSEIHVADLEWAYPWLKQAES